MFAGNSKFRRRNLKLDSENLPPAIPFAYPDNCIYKDYRIEVPNPSREPNTLKLADEAIRLLHSIGEKPIAVVSICGPCRSGKSYFLSQVIGHEIIFEISHTMKSCTRGIWLSTIALECDDFLVLFLDTEGADTIDEGETSKRFSLKLFSFTALLSSFLIYNSRLPKESDLNRIR